MPLSYNYWLKGLAGYVQPTSDGAETTARFGRLNDLVVSPFGGRYQEAALRGNIFQLSLPATTTGIAAGNVTGAAAAASTNFALWNKPGSGVNISLLKFFATVISGTVVGGPLINNRFGANGITIASTLTNGSLTCVNPAKPGPQGAAGVAVSAGTNLTGGTALTADRIMALGYSAGSYADLGGTTNEEDFDGDFILPPGYGWAPCWAAAGTTVLSSYGVTFMETPI